MILREGNTPHRTPTAKVALAYWIGRRDRSFFSESLSRGRGLMRCGMTQQRSADPTIWRIRRSRTGGR